MGESICSGKSIKTKQLARNEKTNLHLFKIHIFKKSIFMLTPNVPSIAKFSVGKFASLESFFVF